MAQVLDAARRRSSAPGRVPPHNLQAEESLLGAMLLSRDAIATAVEICGADDFYKPAHSHIFDAVCSLYGQGEPVDPVTVADELRRSDLLDAVGGPAVLVSLQANTPATSNAARYARIVEEHALLRRLIGVAGEIAEMGYQVPDDVEEAVDRAESLVFEVAQRRVTDSLAPIKDLLSASLDRLEALYDRGESITGVPTGYIDLDERLAGLQPANLVIVGARPSMGKCVAWDTPILDPLTGDVLPAADLCRRGEEGLPVAVVSLGADHRLSVRLPVAFVDDGVRPVFRVRTQLGRELRATLNHRFLTPAGWQPLRDIAAGTSVAVPGHLPFFGDEELADVEVVSLAEAVGCTKTAATEDGAGAPQIIPPMVFRLPRRQLALFLKLVMLPRAAPARGNEGVVHVTSSRRIALGLQHLLLRFGCRSHVKCHPGGAGDESGRYEVQLAADDLFRLSAPGGQPRCETCTSVTAAGRVGGREEDARNLQPGGGDIVWDEVVAVEPDGEDRVFDLTVPGDHNFVAGDVVVHNTSFALGMAAHAAMEAHRPVLLFSLEMSHLEITQRLLCAEARVEATRMRNGRLLESDWPKISHAIGRLGEAPIFIDDNPNLTVMEVRAKTRRLKSRLGDLGLVVVDYLQLMSGRTTAENRQVEVSEMSRGLKILARELEVPVVALSQLSRNLEMRADKRPVLADLRESGCLTADCRVLRADTGEPVSMGELLVSGERDVPVWTLDDELKLVRGRMTHVFPSGIKEVYELRLGSGRRVKASANHPFLTHGGWKRLDELALGNRVAVPCALPAPAVSQPWPDPEVVMLAHFLAGDQRVSDDHPAHARRQLVHLEEVEEAATHFGVASPKMGRGARATLFPPPTDSGSHRSRLEGWLRGLHVYRVPPEERFVPAAVFSLPDEQVAMFLRHVWVAGGSLPVGPGRLRPSFLCRSRHLVEDLQLLLLRAQVQARIHPLHRPGSSTWWRLEVVGAEDQMRFLEAVGISRLVKHESLVGSCARAGCPAEPSRPALRAGGAGLSTSTPGCSTAPTSGPSTSRARLRRVAGVLGDVGLERLAGAEVFWDPVVAICPIGSQPVYDATVVGTHNFVADGVVVHNSLEQDADVVMFIYRDEIYNPESPDRGTAEVIVSKHRNGPTGVTRLAFLDHYTRFANMARGL